MRPKLADDVHRFTMLVPRALIDRIDAWRGRQPGVPNLSEAVRQLLEQSLDPPPRRKSAPPHRRAKVGSRPSRKSSRPGISARPNA
jgi:hypothetical protein